MQGMAPMNFGAFGNLTALVGAKHRAEGEHREEARGYDD
jgi:hypothetical protein